MLDLINLRRTKLTYKNIETLLPEKDNIIIDDKHCLNKSINTVLQFNYSKNTCIPTKLITSNIVDHELLDDTASTVFNVFFILIPY